MAEFCPYWGWEGHKHGCVWKGSRYGSVYRCACGNTEYQDRDEQLKTLAVTLPNYTRIVYGFAE